MTRPRPGRSTLRVLPAAIACLALASACGGSSASTSAAQSSTAPTASVSPEWQKVIDAAKKEGSVTLYSSQGTDQLTNLAAKFQKVYGIKVDVLHTTDAAAEAKINVEHGGTAVADLYSISDSAFVTSMGQAGWVTKATGPDFGNKDYDAATNVTTAGSFVTSAAVFAFAWNTQSVPSGLKSYKDLLDPKLKGKVGVPDPATSPSFVDYYFYLAEQNGQAFVDDLLKSKPQIFPSVLPLAQSLTSGQISAGVAVQALVDEKKAGAPVDFVVPKPAWGARFYTSITSNAPHPNAAQLLADFYVTKAGQEAIANKGGSALPGIAGAVTSIKDVRKPDPAKLTPAAVAAFRAKFKSLTS